MAMRAGIAQIDIWYRTRLTDPFIPARPLDASLILPKVLEPVRRHFSISHCVLDIFMAQVVLKRHRTSFSERSRTRCRAVSGTPLPQSLKDVQGSHCDVETGQIE